MTKDTHNANNTNPEDWDQFQFSSPILSTKASYTSYDRDIRFVLHLTLDETDLFLEQLTLEWINSIVSKRQILKLSVNPENIFSNKGQTTIFYLALMLENFSKVLEVLETKMQTHLLKRLSLIHLARINPNKTYLEGGDIPLDIIKESLLLDLQALKHIKYIPSYSQEYYKKQYDLLQNEYNNPNKFDSTKINASAIKWINEIDTINKVVQTETLDFFEKLYQNENVVWALLRDINEISKAQYSFSSVRRMFEDGKFHTLRFNYDLNSMKL